MRQYMNWQNVIESKIKRETTMLYFSIIYYNSLYVCRKPIIFILKLFLLQHSMSISTFLHL